ncbi:MAG: hypothetical protein Tsb0034_08740 [Ekhidna sp.]
MRTNIDIDDDLLKEMMQLSGAKTKKEAIHDALEKTRAYYSRLGLLELRGKVEWVGDLEEMRTYDKWEEAEQNDL